MEKATASAGRGRPRRPYKTSWGEYINGLRRREHDGRWVIVATGEMFTEPNERLAVARFRQQENRLINIPVLRSGQAKTNEEVNELLGPWVQSYLDEQGNAVMTRAAHADAVWGWVREMLLKQPQYVAELTGIEQLAYLHTIRKPEDSPTLEAVGDLYFEKAKITPSWLTKSKKFWREFCEAVAVRTLREVNQAAVADYKAQVLEASDAPTYAKHRFGAVKTIIGYSKEWGQWAEDRTKALGYCSILIPPTSTSLDPKPISRADFHALLAAADPQMRAMLLLALNACLYAKDVADLKPADLDLGRGVLIADRGKTSVARVAVLWDRTVAAIRALDIKDGVLFRTGCTRQAHNSNTIRKAFRDLRAEAKVDADVQFAQLRDGAYTAACEGEGVQFEHARALGGHRTGISDHYLKRNPKLVAAACRAIETAYFG